MADDFLAKQLPHNVTWGLTMLYSLEHPGNFDDNNSQAGDILYIIFPHPQISDLTPLCCS